MTKKCHCKGCVYLSGNQRDVNQCLLENEQPDYMVAQPLCFEKKGCTEAKQFIRFLGDTHRIQ